VLCQYVDIVEPVLSSIEAITQRCQQTLAALAADAAVADDTDSHFHILEASFFAVFATLNFSILQLKKLTIS